MFKQNSLRKQPSRLLTLILTVRVFFGKCCHGGSLGQDFLAKMVKNPKIKGIIRNKNLYDKKNVVHRPYYIRLPYSALFSEI